MSKVGLNLYILILQHATTVLRLTLAMNIPGNVTRTAATVISIMAIHISVGYPVAGYGRKVQLFKKDRNDKRELRQWYNKHSS